MFWVTIEDPNIAIKKGSSIFYTHFNRKFTSDCPTQHLWNCPICNFDVPTILGEVYVIENGVIPLGEWFLGILTYVLPFSWTSIFDFRSSALK